MARKEVVLVVDDDPQYREMMLDVLKDEGYEVRVASDGVEGMAQLRYWRPVLVVTDMVMPNKEGLELVDYVNENYPDTPVITISGGYRASAKNLEMSRSLGANISLQKPFSIMDLVDAVSGLMHAR